jgi:hypothetical protein
MEVTHMPLPETEPRYKPSQEAVGVLCERLQRMGVSMSESAARALLESVLAVEGPRLDALTSGTLRASLETIQNAAEAALISLTGTPSRSHRDYELSYPPVSESVPVSGKRRGLPSPRPVASRKAEHPEHSEKEESRPVFKRRRDR